MSKSWIFIVLFIVAYLILYLVLRDKLPFTPDFSGSDAFHLNVSFKYYLWQSIRSGVLPFWTDKLAGGFPLIAESQIGAFFLPHYLVFPFFSHFSHAYMFLFAFHLFLLSAGIFLVLKLLKIPSLLSFLLALTFTWCGAISFRWVHFNFLQTFSLAPLLFWTYLKWNGTQKKRYFLVASFLICQMIFAGHMQTTFNFLLALSLIHVLHNVPLTLKKSFGYLSIIILGFLLAAPQIIPTILFSHYSTRSFANVYQYVVYLLFNSNDLIGFISSNALGSPQNATYLIGNSTNRVYWENTPYLGELFVILLFFSSVYYFIRYKKQPFVPIFLIIFFVFLLLAFGGDSPFYFLFGIFPFNIFRTPAKYLLESVFFLILYSAIIFREVTKKHTFILAFIYCALIVNCIILVRTAFSYHVFIDSRKLFSILDASSHIPSDSTYLTFGGNIEWGKEFRTYGWKTSKDINSYLFLSSALLPNSNLITGASIFDVYTGGLRMKRSNFLNDSIVSALTDQEVKSEANNTSIKLENFLQIYNINTLITFQPINLPHFSLISSNKKENVTLTTYQNLQSKNNLFYIPRQIQSFAYLEDVQKAIEQENVSEDYSFVESLTKSIKQNTNAIIIKIINRNDQYLKSVISSPEKKFIVIKKGWYPEWHLYIDGKEALIYKTNLIHIGFFIPQGRHVVELRYIPTSFYIGCGIALLGLGGVAIALIYIARKNLNQS